jgi:phage terminase large subunit-like protein
MLQRKFKAAMVIVEQAGSGISIHQDLRAAGAKWILHAPVKGDKAVRLAQQSAKIEAGQVYLPKEVPLALDLRKRDRRLPERQA